MSANDREKLDEARATAARIAWRNRKELTALETELILIALVDSQPEAEAALANDALFHFRAGEKAQLELTLALEIASNRGVTA